jgi:hypothetical protein
VWGEGEYGVELPPRLEVLEIGVVSVPLGDEFEEQLSARECGRAQHALGEALIAGEGCERHDGVPAQRLEGAGEAGCGDAAEGRCKDFDSTWGAVEKVVEGHSSTSSPACCACLSLERRVAVHCFATRFAVGWATWGTLGQLTGSC